MKAKKSSTSSNKWNYARGLTLVLAATFILTRVYFSLTDDFRISNITFSLSPRTEWDFPLLSSADSETLKHIFNQKFYYLGKGAQVYAFASEDDKWVIKFLKFKHLKPSPFIKLIPPIPPFDALKKANLDRKERKLNGVFEGYRLAYLHDRDHSGLFYLHFNPTNDLNLTAKIVDKIGIERSIALDPLVFIVQKKGNTLRQTLTHLLDKGLLKEAQVKANQILDMYLSEYSLGVWDRDHGITHNTGFVGNKPLHLDVGKLSYDEAMMQPDVFKKDLIHVGYKISAWIKNNYPQYYVDVLASLEKHLSSLLHEEIQVKAPI